MRKKYILKLNNFGGIILLFAILILLSISLQINIKDFSISKEFIKILIQDILISFTRVTFVTLFAWISGTIIGYLIFHFDFLERLLLPSINFIRHISPFAWLPFAIIWFGLGESPIIFIMFITLVFPVIIASTQIFSAIPKELKDEAKVSGAGLLQLFWNVELPVSFGGLINLFRIIWALGWATIIAAEMLGVKSGLGFRLLDFRYLLQYSKMLIYLVNCHTL